MTVVRAVWVTSAADGLDHAVTDEAMAATATQGQGKFRAQCGMAMLSDSLCTPPGAVCPACSAFHRHVCAADAERRQGRWRGRSAQPLYEPVEGVAVRVHTFLGQVVAVLSGRASVFEDPAGSRVARRPHPTPTPPFEEPDVVAFTVARPSPARMYNAALRGKDNFPVDLEANRRIYEAVGERVVRATAFENDGFRQRATAYLVERCGIGQFIDVGCGLPVTREATTHAIAQRYARSARVVYADKDAHVLTHGRALLACQTTTVITADAAKPRTILDHPQVHTLIDFRQPVGVLFIALGHFMPDSADPAGILAAFRDAVPPGSCLAYSHLVRDGKPRHEVTGWQEGFRNASAPFTLRTRHEAQALVRGWDWLAPGLVPAALWEPDHKIPVDTGWIVGGVARKP